MDTMGARIKVLRERAGVSQAKFGLPLGVTRETVSQWEAGKTTPEQHRLAQIADKYGVSLDWLAGRVHEPLPENPNPREKKFVAETHAGGVALVPGKRPDLARDLPILGHARGGMAGVFVSQGEVWGYAMRPESLRGVKEAYAVRVHDESMSPRYEPGTILQVDPFRAPKAGDNVIIQLEDSQAFVKVLKRWNREAGTATCEQFNPRKTVEFRKVTAVHLVVGVDYLER